MREFKIRIFQPIVPEYRVALFNGLGRKYPGRIDIQASQSRGCDNSYPLSSMPYDYNHEFLRIGPFVWQKGLSLHGLEKGDVVVVCGDIHDLSTLKIAAIARQQGIRVVWWGHHVSANAKPLRVGIRLWIAKHLANVMLCYTDAGILYLLERGFTKGKVFATGNTLDMASVEFACHYMRETDELGVSRLERFKLQKGFIGKKILLFCGVMRDKVRVDVLLKALAILHRSRSDWHCVIIGGGERLDEWIEMGNKMGLSLMLTWTGELRGQDKLAPWFLSSDLFVYPGRIGLSLIHAFAYGLPVVLNDNKVNHGPEYVVFSPGINGYEYIENDSKDLASVIDDALFCGNLRKMGERGRLYVQSNYSMERMIERFSEAIDEAARS